MEGREAGGRDDYEEICDFLCFLLVRYPLVCVGLRVGLDTMGMKKYYSGSHWECGNPTMYYHLPCVN